MTSITVARPYAKAAFEWAQDKQLLSQWALYLAQAAKLVADTFAKQTLSHPEVSSEAAADFVLKSLANSDKAFSRFICLLAERHRLLALPAIFEHFSTLKKESEAMIEGELITAIEPGADFVQTVSKTLSKRLNKKVVLQNTVEPAILGGALIKMGDIVIDGSLKGKLAKIADALIN